MNDLSRLFNAHPASVGESYGTHCRFALRIAGTLAWASLAALIHAFLPFLFERTASLLIEQIHQRTQLRH